MPDGGLVDEIAKAFGRLQDELDSGLIDSAEYTSRRSEIEDWLGSRGILQLTMDSDPAKVAEAKARSEQWSESFTRRFLRDLDESSIPESWAPPH